MAVGKHAILNHDVPAGYVDAQTVLIAPDLMAMQSSPSLKELFLISTSVQESGSQESVFGLELRC